MKRKQIQKSLVLDYIPHSTKEIKKCQNRKCYFEAEYKVCIGGIFYLLCEDCYKKFKDLKNLKIRNIKEKQILLS